MIIQVADSGVFIPSFNCNNKLPPSDQIRVHYKRVGLKEKARYLVKPDPQFNYDADGKVVGGNITMRFDRKPVIDGMVTKIENCDWEDGDGEHAITNARELLAAPVEFDELVDEVAEHLRKQLERKIDEKN